MRRIYRAPLERDVTIKKMNFNGQSVFAFETIQFDKRDSVVMLVFKLKEPSLEDRQWVLNQSANIPHMNPTSPAEYIARFIEAKTEDYAANTFEVDNQILSYEDPEIFDVINEKDTIGDNEKMFTYKLFNITNKLRKTVISYIDDMNYHYQFVFYIINVKQGQPGQVIVNKHELWRSVIIQDPVDKIKSSYPEFLNGERIVDTKLFNILINYKKLLAKVSVDIPKRYFIKEEKEVV